MEISEQALFKGFSCPAETFYESFLNVVVVQYARAILEVFLGRFRAELKQCVSVTNKLEEVVISELEFNTVWSPALTMCFRATSLRNSSLARKAAAEVLLHAAARGVQGDWEIELAKPGFFLWDSWLLPKCDYLSVSNAGETASVITRGEGRESRILFRRNLDGAVRWSCDGGTLLPSIITEYGPVVILPEGTLNPADLDGFRDSRPLAPKITPLVSRNFESALDLLRDFFPSYGKWVCRVIRTAAVADLKEMNDVKGGVVPGACGVVFIYDHQDVLSQADALVHGAAHNYFYLLTALGSPVDPLSNELYYSPFVSMMRTFDGVLASYHAFANGYLFYRTCRDTLPAFKQICAERMKNTLENLRRAEQVIKESKGLTHIGSALIEPLIQELQNEA